MMLEDTLTYNPGARQFVRENADLADTLVLREFEQCAYVHAG